MSNSKHEIDVLFGVSPNSTPSFRYAQPWRDGGGGGTTILWTRNHFGKLYVGAVLQQRNFIDQLNPVFNVMRGYTEPGEARSRRPCANCKKSRAGLAS